MWRSVQPCDCISVGFVSKRDSFHGLAAGAYTLNGIDDFWTLTYRIAHMTVTIDPFSLFVSLLSSCLPLRPEAEKERDGETARIFTNHVIRGRPIL